LLTCPAGRDFPAQWNANPSATASRKLHLQRIETPHSCVRGVPRHNLLESSSVLPFVERANFMIYAACHPRAARLASRTSALSLCLRISTSFKTRVCLDPNYLLFIHTGKSLRGSTIRARSSARSDLR
jgi:hypothetical protein